MSLLDLIKHNIYEQFTSLGHKERLVSIENMENVSRDETSLNVSGDGDKPFKIDVSSSSEVTVSEQDNVPIQTTIEKKESKEEKTEFNETIENKEMTMEQIVISSDDINDDVNDDNEDETIYDGEQIQMISRKNTIEDNTTVSSGLWWVGLVSSMVLVIILIWLLLSYFGIV